MSTVIKPPKETSGEDINQKQQIDREYINNRQGGTSSLTFPTSKSVQDVAGTDVLEAYNKIPYWLLEFKEDARIKLDQVENSTIKGVKKYSTNLREQEASSTVTFVKIQTTDFEKSISFTHQHEFGEDARFFGNFKDKAVNFMKNLTNIVTNEGKDKVEMSKDTIEKYISSSRQTIEIPFVLMTGSGEDFFTDILQPLFLLVSMSYPRLAAKFNVKNLFDKALKNAEATLKAAEDAYNKVYNKSSKAEQSTKSSNTITDAKELSDSAKSEVDKLKDLARSALQSDTTGGFHYRIDMPYTVNINHSSGLYGAKNHHIVGVQYEFSKPWLTYKDTMVPQLCTGIITLKAGNNLYNHSFLEMLDLYER